MELKKIDQSKKWIISSDDDRFELSAAKLSNLHTKRDWQSLLPKTVADAKNDHSPSLATIKKYHGLMTSYMCIARFLWMLKRNSLAKTNIPDTIQNETMVDMCVMLFGEYYYLKLSELKFIAKQFLLGKYGKDYNRLDLQTISEAIEQYIRDRLIVSETEKKLSDPVLSGKRSGMPESTKELLKALEEKFPEPKSVTPDDMKRTIELIEESNHQK